MKYVIFNDMHWRFLGVSLVLLFWTIKPTFGQKSISGVASYYHDSLEGNLTASGEVFRQDKFTAAHKSLPFDTWILLSDPTGHSVVARINDRLPANSSRMIDLTTRAALQLKMINDGLKKVRMRVISENEAWKWYLEHGYLGLMSYMNSR